MDQTPGVSDSPQNASGTAEQNDLKTKYEQDKQDGIAYDTYKKAVGQYKKANEKAAELEARLSAFEQDKMSAEGKKDEVISQLRTQLSELESKHKASQQSYTWNVVGAQIKSEMATRGIRDPEKALKFATAVHKEDLGGIEIDDNYNVNKQDMQRFVDRFLEENKDMGWQSQVRVNDMTPGNNVEMGDKPEISKMSVEELTKFLAK